MILRPLDEVGNDEEVAGIFHPLDHLQLEGQPLAVFLDGASGREPVRRDTALQARLGARPQLGAFVDSAVADREARQDRLFGERPECATLGDLDRRGQCLRQVGKQRGHLGAALEIMLGGKLAAVGLGDDAPFRDRNQRVMGVVILALGEERLVGGDEGNVPGIGQLDQRAFGGALARRAVALQLHVQPVAKQLLQGGAARAGEIGLPGDDCRIERPARPAGERDQAVGCAVEPGKLQMRLLVRRRFEEGPRAQLHQAAIARLAGGQQHDPRQGPHPSGKPRVARLVAEIERQRTADNRLDAVAGELFGEFERPEHVVGVGQRQRRLVIRLRKLRQLGDGQRAFEQRIGGMHVQMHEAGVGGHGMPQRFGFKRWWGRRAAVSTSIRNRAGFPQSAGRKLGQNTWASRDPAVLAGGEPPSWLGSRASPASDAIHVRLGMGATDVNTRGRRV